MRALGWLDAPAATSFPRSSLPAPPHTIVETVGHQHITHPATNPPLPALNVLPNALQNFLLWRIGIFPNKFHLDV
jgi:hypothetical protein